MSIFGSFTTGNELNDRERKWNKMWDLWAEGDAESPYAELMEYDSEVNNGGHFQYFFNVTNCGDLHATINKILPILPEPLHENLKKGYAVFTAQEDISDDRNFDFFMDCDNVFYSNEQLLLDILTEYADSLNL